MHNQSVSKTHLKISSIVKTAGAALLALPLGISIADEAPPTTPLSLQTSVPPNIFFLNDDSGSMDYELLIRNSENHARLGGVRNASPRNEPLDEHTPPIIHRSVPFSALDVRPPGETNWCVFSGTAAGSLDNDGGFPGYEAILQTEGIKDCDVVSEKEWRARLHDINPLYYNPSKTYRPWPGVDAEGDPLYEDMDIESADIDPADENSLTINLETESGELDENGKRTLYGTSEWSEWCKDNLQYEDECGGWRYYTWDDANDDERISSGELDVHWVNELSDSEQTNFANWFSYHRNRRGVARYALGKAILAAEGSRVGYGAINEIRANTDREVLINNPSFSQQSAVLDALYTNRSDGIDKATPLQESFNWVGKYFEKSGGNDSPPSPILSTNEGGACQINSAIVMTDGFYTDEKVYVNNVAQKDGNGNWLVRFYDRSGINNADADTGNAFDGPPYNKGENHADTLADIAMYYYKTDLDGDPDNNDVPPSSDGVDTATHQHLNTYTVAFGLAGTIDPETVDIESADFSWPDPETNVFHDTSESIPERIDDLFHAAVNGRGKYLNASNPDALIESLSSIVRSIIDGRQMGTNAISTSSFFLDDRSKIFVTSFDTNTWSGELKAYSGNTDINSIRKASWDESPGLWRTNNTLTEGQSRTIVTYSGPGENNITAGTGIPFQWNSLPATHKAPLTNDLDASDSHSDLDDSDQRGESRLDYLRGGIDANFRTRASVLGDIIGSSPKHVGPPPMIYPDAAPFGTSGTRFSTFWRAHNITTPRTPVVYVGANDGMLHGFNANTGAEVLAYVPYSVFGKLKKLTEPSYTHDFFVDQTPTVTDAFFSPKGSGNTKWSTVLVGGLGTGGKGLYALNITDPNNFSEANADDIVLWEFTDDNDSDFGYSLAKPVIALTESGRWAVITGNGYNSDSGDAALFIIYLDANPEDGWDSDDYLKISIPNSGNTKNGLFSPTAVDVDSDGMVDRVYAGDLKGNLWAFDISDSDSDNWQVAYESGGDILPLFKAYTTDGNGNNIAQPITAKPTVIRHPTEPKHATDRPVNLMVYFGTGRYFLSSDLNNNDTQSFYAVWDTGVNGDLDRDSLTTQTLITDTDSTLQIEARVTDNISINYSDSSNAKRFGWYIDLQDKNTDTDVNIPGERVFTEAMFFQGIIFFTTYTPTGSTCGGGGSSWFMFLDALDGSYPDKPIISINNDALVDSNDVVDLTDDNNSNATSPSGLRVRGTFASPTLTNRSIILSTSEGSVDIRHNLANNSALGQRLSWKELRQE